MFNFFKKTKEKAEIAIVETREKVNKLADSADELINNGTDLSKTIGYVVLAVGATMVITNLVNIGSNIYLIRHNKQSNINIYITNKESSNLI